MTPGSWRALRLLAGVAVLGVVVWRTGSGPFVDGLRSLDATTLALGAAIAIPTTVACAWRWHLVARGLGVGVGVAPAVASYYRSQFLNTILPAGIVGDVHRGVRHGRTAGNAGLGLRSVAWERFAGQVVQAVITTMVLLLLPSPVRSSVPALLGVLAAAFLMALVLRQVVPTEGTSRVARVLRGAREDLRLGVLARRAWPGVVLASTIAVTGHVATYLVAARAVGITTSPARLIPLALLVLVAMAIPLNVAGWGPREGVAAWSFAAAGLGAGQGVATAVAYGAMVTVASLPGALVLLAASRRSGTARPTARSRSPLLVMAEGGASRG
jgi:uncharacterized membrane protein YbhN (UPF0104 family)